MSKKVILLCHGWGFDQKFWSPMIQLFAKDEIKLLNLGYFGTEITDQVIETDTNYVGIGHSLGMAKLILLFGNRLNRIIGINGFVNFLGKNTKLRNKRTYELTKMLQAFKHDPHGTLQNFHIRALKDAKDIQKQLPSGKMDIQKLLTDLENLTSPISVPEIPTLILGSISDRIVPVEILYDNFSNHEIILFERGGHNLIGSLPSSTYGLIERFLRI
ncbi:alpha/beta fold hydrolase [Neorickettsia findlayensis]|uniref:Alpha/beta hydrolase n=1 Tax=Neorickettsia findlayensis TaxID=2686014 RepID=A0A6P1GAH9_9RICK|nr:alpha/beta hydrolase [Neorickettsia findlayensis]QHD65300.1 alpha/beta hydrolase [Neorickettsia findlayensis]